MKKRERVKKNSKNKKNTTKKLYFKTSLAEGIKNKTKIVRKEYIGTL